MKLRVLFLSILFLMISGNCISQKSVEFKTTKENAQKKNIKNILIAGVGESSARMFIERLMQNFIGNLKDRNLSAEYQFLSSDVKAANKQLNEIIQNKQYDGILLFFQSDTAAIDKIYSSNFVPTPWGTMSSTKSNLAVDLQFKIHFFERNTASSFYDASLNVYGDLSKKSIFSDVCEKLIKSFQDNRVFW